MTPVSQSTVCLLSRPGLWVHSGGEADSDRCSHFSNHQHDGRVNVHDTATRKGNCDGVIPLPEVIKPQNESWD